MNRTHVASSSMRSVGYDPDTETLEIEFDNGIYQYQDVPETVYQELMAAESLGLYFVEKIKDQYRFERVG